MWSQSATRGLLLVAMLTAGCTERNPDYCAKNSDCSGHRICDVVRATCVSPDAAVTPVVDAGVADVAADTAVDSPVVVDGGGFPVDGGGSPVDASTVEVAQTSEAGRPVDGRVADAALPDVYVPDGPGTCGVNGDCADPTKAFCVAGVCVGCQGAGATACGAQACDTVSGKCVECVADTGCTKDPAKGFCVLNACTACSTTGATGCAARADGKTACAPSGTLAGQCVECIADAGCTKDPTKAFCVANACTGCGASGATGCAARTDGKTSCAASGASAGQCVECLADTGCTKDPAKGFCVANACTGCNTPGATGCTRRTDGKLVCAPSGTAAGQCVECTGDSQCTSNVAKGFCVANACTGCNTPGATGCAARTDGKAVCAAAGTLAGQCVACASSGDCKVATSPICTAVNVCVACTADSQCVAKLGATGNPGVCMSNLDGHCATDAETVYVQNVTACSNNIATGGTSAVPYCDTAFGVNAAASTNGKILTVLAGALSSFSVSVSAKPLTIVGKAATITPIGFNDGIDVTAGEVYLRGITVQGSLSAQTKIGINAGASVTLHMDTCSIVGNPGGGILLNGAAFDIENTTITGNGPGTLGLASWGGIAVNNPPASGPTTLNLVTVQNNKQVGLACSAAVSGTGVLATGNAGGVDIGASCGFTSCSTSAASATCGAQGTP